MWRRLSTTVTSGTWRGLSCWRLASSSLTRPPWYLLRFVVRRGNVWTISRSNRSIDAIRHTAITMTTNNQETRNNSDPQPSNRYQNYLSALSASNSQGSDWPGKNPALNRSLVFLLIVSLINGSHTTRPLFHLASSATALLLFQHLQMQTLSKWFGSRYLSQSDHDRFNSFLLEILIPETAIFRVRSFRTV